MRQRSSSRVLKYLAILCGIFAVASLSHATVVASSQPSQIVDDHVHLPKTALIGGGFSSAALLLGWIWSLEQRKATRRELREMSKNLNDTIVQMRNEFAEDRRESVRQIINEVRRHGG